jgi:competence protein ComEC
VRGSIVFLLGFCLALACPAAQAQTAKTLDIYLIDVEGGNATLFVAPSGESVLIDTGNGGPAATRDVGRIMAAVKEAGLTQIDNLITTHWHGDHFGGMAEFAGRIPIRHFIDHGPNVQQPNPAAEAFLQTTYPELYSKAKHTVAKPGDKLSVTGLDWRLVSSAGDVITAPLSGTGSPNPYCANFKPMDDDGGVENAMSVGSIITFGKFRMEQGIQYDVPDQPCRRHRSVGGFPSWSASIEFGSARACDSPAGGHHEQRHP